MSILGRALSIRFFALLIALLVRMKGEPSSGSLPSSLARNPMVLKYLMLVLRAHVGFGRRLFGDGDKDRQMQSDGLKDSFEDIMLHTFHLPSFCELFFCDQYSIPDVRRRACQGETLWCCSRLSSICYSTQLKHLQALSQTLLDRLVVEPDCSNAVHCRPSWLN